MSDKWLLQPRRLKSAPANNPPMADAVADIIDYHDRTKHQPERYANGPGGLDWATQPDPFRRFSGAPVFRLPLASLDDTPPAASLFGAASVTSRPFTLARWACSWNCPWGFPPVRKLPVRVGICG